MNVIRCDKLSTTVAAVRAHPDEYEKDFDAVAYLLPIINMHGPMLSIEVASITYSRPVKRQKTSPVYGTFN